MKSVVVISLYFVPGLYPDPNTLILLQTEVHIRQLDSAASPSDNNLEFVKTQPDVCK